MSDPTKCPECGRILWADPRTDVPLHHTARCIYRGDASCLRARVALLTVSLEVVTSARNEARESLHLAEQELDRTRAEHAATGERLTAEVDVQATRTRAAETRLLLVESERDAALLRAEGADVVLRLAAQINADQLAAVKAIVAQRDDAEARWRAAENQYGPRCMAMIVAADRCGGRVCGAPASWSPTAKAYRCAACAEAKR